MAKRRKSGARTKNKAHANPATQAETSANAEETVSSEAVDEVAAETSVAESAEAADTSPAESATDAVETAAPEDSTPEDGDVWAKADGAASVAAAPEDSTPEDADVWAEADGAASVADAAEDSTPEDAAVWADASAVTETSNVDPAQPEEATGDAQPEATSPDTGEVAPEGEGNAAQTAPEGESSEASLPDEAAAGAGAEVLELTPDAAGGEPGEGAPAEGEEAQGTGLDLVQLGNIIESLLFASDKALGMADLKRLLVERDAKKVTAAVEALMERRKGTGIEVVKLANGWHLRTNPEFADWVSKLLAGKPMRLSRAMMETLAIVAYRQPVTRPEIDDIRGVDCGPVLKTLLDRGLVRIIGKKEEVGRPMLYGTTPEFLRVFNLRDLAELPSLREFYELSAEQQNRVDEEHPAPEGASAPAGSPAPAAGEGSAAAAPDSPNPPSLGFVPRGTLPDEPDDSDPLLDELETASKAASKVLGSATEPGESTAESNESEAAPAEGAGPDPDPQPEG